MTLYIHEPDVEQLLEMVVSITGESKSEAMRKALQERHQRISGQPDAKKDIERVLLFLENEVWAHIPPEILGTRLTKEEEEKILGYGEFGA